MAGQHHGHQERADRGRGAQDAQPKRAGLQNVARIDRQQRRDAAEQHSEQVERDGAEDRRIVADEADAGVEIVVRILVLQRRLLRRPQEAGQHRAGKPEHHDDQIWQARRKHVSQPADRGAGDGRNLRRAA